MVFIQERAKGNPHSLKHRLKAILEHQSALVSYRNITCIQTQAVSPQNQLESSGQRVSLRFFPFRSFQMQSHHHILLVINAGVKGLSSVVQVPVLYKRLPYIRTGLLKINLLEMNDRHVQRIMGLTDHKLDLKWDLPQAFLHFQTTRIPYLNYIVTYMQLWFQMQFCG